MFSSLHRWTPVLFLAVGGLSALRPASVQAGETDDTVAVFSSVSPAYKRSTRADGSVQPETYAFGEGGFQGGPLNDFTIDRLKFLDIARRIAPALTAANYVTFPANVPGHPDLLVMVYWGTTTGTESTSSSPAYQIAQSLNPPPLQPVSPPPTGLGGTEAAAGVDRGSELMARAVQQAVSDSAQQQSALLTGMANRQRDHQNRLNAEILGFAGEMKRVADYQTGPLSQHRQDVEDEVAESRYYVVLLAYDFELLQKRQERKLLWETRFSIRQHHNNFQDQLTAMAQSASRYFGQDSGGLTRKSMREEHVNLGELKILGVEPDRK